MYVLQIYMSYQADEVQLVDVGRSYFTTMDMLHSILKIGTILSTIFEYSLIWSRCFNHLCLVLYQKIQFFVIITAKTNWFAFSLVCINFTLPRILFFGLSWLWVEKDVVKNMKSILNSVCFELFVFHK